MRPDTTFVFARMYMISGISNATLIGAAALACHVAGITYAAKQESLDRVGNLWPLLLLAVPLIAALPVLFEGWTTVAAFVLLLPLYFSQRRDLARLHAWMEREPGHPASDLAASEGLLDRAETELEAAFGPKPAAPAEADAGGQVAAPTLVGPLAPAP